MHAAFKLREFFEKEKVPVVIDGGGNNELPGRIVSYDIVVSNSQVTVKTDKPVFSAIPLLTGIGEKELMAQVLKAAKEIQARKG
jgi:PTS system galactitol-specific IIB component